jgi:regulatory protein
MGERPRASARDRALRLLAERSRSREELRRRLARAGYEPDEVAVALASLDEAGLVDDEAFAREVVAHEVGRKGLGRRAAMSSLRRRGVDAETAERVLDEAGPQDEEARADELARARAARMTGLAPQVAHRRLVSFLARRGYDARVAHASARRALGDEE